MNKTIKRFLAFLLIPVVLWLAACGKTAADEPSTDAPTQESASAAPTEERTAGLTPEDKLAGINELEPNAKGVYQIKSIGIHDRLQNLFCLLFIFFSFCHSTCLSSFILKHRKHKRMSELFVHSFTPVTYISSL